MKRVKEESYQKNCVTRHEYNSSHPLVNIQPTFDNVIYTNNSTSSLPPVIDADNNADHDADNDADHDADNDAIIDADNVAIGTPVNLVRVGVISPKPDSIIDAWQSLLN